MSLHEFLHPLAGGYARPLLASLAAGSILLAAALLICRRLEGRPAALRSLLLFLALLVYALPFHAAFVSLNRLAPSDFRVKNDTAQLILAGRPQATVMPGESGGHADWECPLAVLIMAGWLVGGLSVLRRLPRSYQVVSEARGGDTRLLDRVDEARRSMSVTEAVPLIVASGATAPSVMGILHPFIVLPAKAVDDLEEEEIRGVILHEMAHIARKDNLLRLVETAIVTVYWFNPLVWMVRSRGDLERERACDERTVDHMPGPDPLLRAIYKLCRGTVVPEEAPISCISGSRIGARVHGLGRPRSTSLLPVLLASVVLVITTAVGLAAALLVDPPAISTQTDSGFGFSVRTSGDDPSVLVEMEIRDATGSVLSSPRVNTLPSGETVVNTTSGNLRFEVVLRFDSEDRGEARLTARRSDRIVADVRKQFVVDRINEGER
jgi:beta-lactamase regulating signal transducer with metallopeptidase domain